MHGGTNMIQQDFIIKNDTYKPIVLDYKNGKERILEVEHTKLSIFCSYNSPNLEKTLISSPVKEREGGMRGLGRTSRLKNLHNNL